MRFRAGRGGALPISRPVDWAPLLAGMDGVVHLAGIAHTGTDVSDATVRPVNHLATARTCARSRSGPCAPGLSSPRSARRAAPADPPLDENDPPRPTEGYGRSKLAAEQAVRAAGVPYTILRPVLVYAPGAKGNLANLIGLRARRCRFRSARLANRRSLLARRQSDRGDRFRAGDARAANETFIVADPQAVSVAEIVAICRARWDGAPACCPLPPSLFAHCSADRPARAWQRLPDARGADRQTDGGRLAARDRHTRRACGHWFRPLRRRSPGTASRNTP
jgi:UDP-glucose 4-epimerase